MPFGKTSRRHGSSSETGGHDPLALDLAFVKRLRQFLMRHNDLRDWAELDYDGDLFRHPDTALEHFRNHPRDRAFQYQDHGRRHFVYRPNLPTYGRLLEHLIHQQRDTLWVTNSQRFNVVLMCADIDAKDGETDSQAHAEHLSGLFGGRTFIEPSVGGVGRHAFFLCDLSYVRRATVKGTLSELSMSLRRYMVGKYASKFDLILGDPTVWQNNDGTWSIESRGYPVRVPYCTRAYEDLGKLEGLIPVEFGELQALCERLNALSEVQRERSSPSGPLLDKPICVGHTATYERKISGLSGFQKKVRLVSRLFHLHQGPPDLEEAYREYIETCEPTGFSTKDVRRRYRVLRQVIRRFTKTFEPGHHHAFRRNQYLDVVKQLVPADAFIWTRREKLDHERLADFVSVKVQDAFFKKARFQARASRDATIANIRSLKRKGILDWTCTTNMYTRLLRIACDYTLLRVYDEYVPPGDRAQGSRRKGLPRLVGPGPALAEEFEEFRPIAMARRRPDVACADPFILDAIRESEPRVA